MPHYLKPICKEDPGPLWQRTRPQMNEFLPCYLALGMVGTFFSESFLTPNYVSVLRHSLVGNTVWHQCLPSAEGPQCWGTLETTWERVWAGNSRTPFSRQSKSLVDEDHMQSSIGVPKRMLDPLKKMTQDNPRPQMAGISVWIYPLTSLGVFVCSISESGFL